MPDNVAKNARSGSIAGSYSPLMLLHVSSAQDRPPCEGPATGETTAEAAEASPRDNGAAAAAATAAGAAVDAGALLAGLAGLTGLTAAVEREHERAAHREAIIDRLHEDNQALRRGELQAMFEPVRAALYRLHDLTRREAERWATPDPPDAAHTASLLTAVTDEIAEALARTGVERFAVKPGDPFDPARHRPVATEPVMDPALDGTVVRVRADGFEQGGRVVRKAEVCVGRPAPSAISETDTTTGSAPLPRPNR